MMADGGALGAPAPIGGGVMPPPPGAGGLDADQDQDQNAGMGGSAAVSPEAVHYHDDPQNCQGCSHMGDGGHCEVLQMQVSPEGACSAYDAKAGEGAENGMMPGEDMGGQDQGTSGYQQ